jgi:hypothetical protein
MPVPDKYACEAGINGGYPEFGRELHRAELDMDSVSEPTFELSSFWIGLAELISLPQKGTDAELRGYLRRVEALSHASRRTVGSFVQRQTKTRNGITPTRLSRHVARSREPP